MPFTARNSSDFCCYLAGRVLRLAASLFLIVHALGLTSVNAQRVPLSQPSTVSQRIGLAEIRLHYNRPAVRGRVLWGEGGVVKWDTLWHPGANNASRIERSPSPTGFHGGTREFADAAKR